ncbi:hypothetical protein ACROYT_G039416 [Oculina patagonica]
MADISLDTIKDFFSLKPLPKQNAVTDVKITGRQWDEGRNNPNRQQFKLPKKIPRSPPPSPAYVGEYCSTGPKLEDLYNELDQLELDPPSGASDEIPAALKEEEASHIFENYSFDHTYSPDLPITCYRQQIVDTIESNSVTIVQGATGSGKTTQVPQYILDEYAKNQRYCNIIVTQPRRIAAISIAKRVCQERGWTLGSLVGYQVGRDKCLSEDTRLSYVTTGVLLQRLIQAKNMNQYTHVFLDEVHERDQDSDFCLLVVKKLLRTNSRHVKVVLMSATIESDLFSMYFAVPVRGRVEGAPVVTVEGKSFPVVESYLDELTDVGMIPDNTLEEPGIDKVGYELAARLIYHLDELERMDNLRQGKEGPRGTVLMFLPGYFEIKQMDQVLDEMCAQSKLWLLPLHSRLTTLEQGGVFKKPDEGYRKVILATNIAESSITVPDIKYVIDFCLERCLVCDPETNFQSLRIQWASKASATQRKGRAGRVSAGTCYRMVTKEFYESCLPEFGIPEMQRCPLEQVVLKVKLLDIGPPKAVLRLALQPPDSDDIERTVLLLKQVGALTIVMKNGTINPCDGELTFIGKVLGSLPVDVHLGKLLVLSYVFGCLEECLVISASLSLQSFFAYPFRKEFDSYSKKMAWSDYSHSDCIAVLNAYKEWNMLKRRKGFSRGEGKWCQENMIQPGRIREVEQLVEELTNRLKDLNLRTIRPLHQKATTQESLLILKLVICGAFYPNYFLSSDIDEAEAMKVMSGHDPFTTVMVRSMPPHGVHYRSAIARMFRQCGKGKALYFEESRAYIEFERPRVVDRGGSQSNSIVPAVYKAIKMRHLRIPLNLFISEARNAQMDRQMEQRNSFGEAIAPNRLRTNRMATNLSSRGTGSVELMEEPQQVNLPQKGYLEIITAVVINPGQFWCQKPDTESARKLQILQGSINMYDGRNLERIERRDLSVGTLCLALFDEDDLFYRARVLAIRDSRVEVFFLDFGNEAVVKIGHLRKMKREYMNLPFQAFECRLCEVAPMPTANCPVGAWSPIATQRFIQLTENRKLAAKVYSLVRNVLSLDLYDTNTEEDVHINQVLIDEGYALFQEESRASKMAHQTAFGDSSLAEDNTAWIYPSIDNDIDEMNRNDVVTKVTLRGPESPIEMGFYSITSIGRLRSVRVEQNSVNSVILNDQPHDPHQRFLVAANISINATGSTVVARDTTLMPNIHGLMPLVALLFAPYAEMRVDREMRQYTGALVGLGYDPTTSEALLPDHDSELVFDVDITEKDIVEINSLRTAINLAFQSEQAMSEWGTPAVERIQNASRSIILKLVLKRRENKTPCPFPRTGYWNQIDPAYILNAATSNGETDAGLLYTLHKAVAISGKPLEDEDEEARLKVAEQKEKMEWLRSLEGRSSEQFTNEVVCPLCNVVCRHPRGVSMHLRSATHKDYEASLYED